MNDYVEIGNLGVRAKVSEHESGLPMIAFNPFPLQSASKETVLELIDSAKVMLKSVANILRICLEPDQKALRLVLEDMDFTVDGYEYGMPLDKLAQFPNTLPPDFTVRPMIYDEDIDAIVAIEKAVHAADETSRVSFETDEAVAGMRRYYERACAGIGVYLLLDCQKIVGILGFLPDSDRSETVHISSVAIALAYQRRGLFFPFLIQGLNELDTKKYKSVSGVTTTTKLIAVAEKYGVELLGLSLSQG